MGTETQNENEMSRKEWFYRFRRGTRVGPIAGPFTLEELRGRLTVNDYVQKSGTQKWMRACEVDELKTIFHMSEGDGGHGVPMNEIRKTMATSPRVKSGWDGCTIGMYVFLGVSLLAVIGIESSRSGDSSGTSVLVFFLGTLVFCCLVLPALLFCGAVNSRAVELVWRARRTFEPSEVSSWTTVCAKVFFFLAGISTGGIVFAIEMLIVVLAAKGNREKMVEKNEASNDRASTPVAS